MLTISHSGLRTRLEVLMEEKILTEITDYCEECILFRIEKLLQTEEDE